MAAPTVEAVYTSHSNDGGNAGKAVTTDTTPTTDDYLLYCMAVNANGDTLTPPAGGWTEATVSDNSIATAGGQIRAWYLKNPADSTTYTWTVASSTRRTCIALLIRGADGTTFVDVKESAQSGPGTNHTPPALTTTVADTLVVDFAALRQFSPDTSDWTVPASGLTWTERADLQGSDGNNNVRLAAGTATKATAGAIGTAVWTNTDANEDSIIIRIAVNPAAGGGDATATPAAVAAVVALPAPTISAGSTATPAAVASTVALPAATVSAGSTESPAAVASVVSLPAPTVSAGSTVTPSAVASVVALPAPTISAGSTETPAAIAAVAALPAATISAGSTVTPGAIAALVSIPQVTVDTAGNATVTPATIGAVVAVQSVTIAASSTATPATVAALVSVPQVSIPGTTAKATSTATVTAGRTSTAAVTAQRTSTSTVGG